MPQACFLLTDATHFGAQRLAVPTAARLGRADGPDVVAGGRRSQLRRYFPLPPDAWPVAALSRQADVGDAADGAWLRADPAYLRPDINGVRLMAHGAGLGVSAADSAALLPALVPLFAGAGMLLDAPVPERWYLRLPPGSGLPAFSDPGEALGADLFDHDAVGDDARRWRALSAEVQILLHNHEWNQRRAADGRLPVNALWFWGGGELPATRQTKNRAHGLVFGADPTLIALAGPGGAAPLPASFEPGPRSALFDLADIRDLAALDRHWLQPALAGLDRGAIDRLLLDTADGQLWTMSRRSRWRLWRRTRMQFAA
jgi:hypothetical protein